MYRKLIFILIAWTSFNVNLFAEMKLAIIKDTDGFTNIRSGQGSKYEIIGQIKSSEFFYYEQSNGDWYAVIAFQWLPNGEQLKGYVYKSRICAIIDLPINEQKNIISKVFRDYIKFNEQWVSFHALQKQKKGHFNNPADSIKAMELSIADFKFIDSKYDPILIYFPSFFCKTKDTAMLELLFNTIWANKGSANEQPSFTLEQCYVCNENLFLSLLQSVKNREQLDLLINDTIWGLENYFDIDEDSKTITNKNFSRLKDKLIKK